MEINAGINSHRECEAKIDSESEFDFWRVFGRATFQGQEVHAKSTMDTLKFLLL